MMFDLISTALLGPFTLAKASLPTGIVTNGQSISAAAASALLTAILQGAVLTAGVAICLKFVPRATASLRFAVWSTTFVVLLVLPFAPLATASATVPLFDSSSVATPIATAQNGSLLQADARWGLAIALLWLVASLYRAAKLAIHLRRLRVLWKSASPVRSLKVGATQSHIFGRTEIEICTTDRIDRPSLIGFFVPRILIPEALFARLIPAELDHIILHETEHLRRWDDWTNLLQKLSVVLFPLNPALLWIERQLCREREMACDDGVVRRTNAPRAYAACLASIAEQALRDHAEALSLGAWERRPELLRRVQSILARKQPQGQAGWRSLAAIVGTVLIIATVAVAHCPQLIAFVPSQQAAIIARSVALRATQPASQDVAVTAPATDKATASKIRRTRASRHEAANTAPSPFDQQDWTVAQVSASDAIVDPAQNWIVLTEWRTESATGDTPHVDPRRTPSQLTVTRLVFRVVQITPGKMTPGSAVPTSLPEYAHWLVFQL